MTIEHIQQSIQKALGGYPNLTDELSIRGFSTPTQRRLMANLCENASIYLEVGLYCGATFCSSFNKGLTAIGIENYSQDFSVSTVKDELTENLSKFSDNAKEAKVYYEDCYKMDLSALPKNIDILYFDSEHSFDSHAKALPHFFDNMADVFCFVVDDAAWVPVATGTEAGFANLADKLDVIGYWPLRGLLSNNDPIFHNGINIYLIKKK